MELLAFVKRIFQSLSEPGEKRFDLGGRRQPSWRLCDPIHWAIPVRPLKPFAWPDAPGIDAALPRACFYAEYPLSTAGGSRT